MIDIAAITSECVQRLGSECRVVAVLIGGSAAFDPEHALDLDLCVFVHDPVMRQARMYIDSTAVDLFVCGIERTRRALKEGLEPHLLSILATGKHMSGEQGASANLQTFARAVIARPAPEPSPMLAFSLREGSHALLKKFEDVRKRDRATAGLIVATLTRRSVDAYFALNCIRTTGIRHTMKALFARNPAGAAALQRVLDTPLADLCEDPEPLRNMVETLVGRQRTSDVWIT